MKPRWERLRVPLLLGSLLLGSLPGSAGAASYTVQRGDTLSSIARRTGTSVTRLMRVNGLRSTLIEPGQVLRTSPASHSAAKVSAVPATVPVFQSGLAVYYGGRRDPQTPLTAAHLSLPFGTWVEVTHRRTGRRVTVKINDRGPFNGGGRIIDLSLGAARALGTVREGVAPVHLRVLPRP